MLALKLRLLSIPLLLLRFRGYYDDEPVGVEEEVIEGEEGPEGGIEVLDSAPQSGGGAVTERTTTPYMTKYERARILGVERVLLFFPQTPTPPYHIFSS